MFESQIYFLKRQIILVDAQAPQKKVFSLAPALWLFSSFVQLRSTGGQASLQQGHRFSMWPLHLNHQITLTLREMAAEVSLCG